MRRYALLKPETICSFVGSDASASASGLPSTSIARSSNHAVPPPLSKAAEDDEHRSGVDVNLNLVMLPRRCAADSAIVDLEDPIGPGTGRHVVDREHLVIMPVDPTP